MHLFYTFLVAALVSLPGLSYASQNYAKATTPDTAALYFKKQFTSLTDQYNEKLSQFCEARKASPKKSTELFTTLHPMNTMGDKFLQLEFQSRGTQYGFSCLYHLVAVGGGVSDRDVPATTAKGKALLLLGEHYHNYPDIDSVFRQLDWGARIDESKKFLEMLIANSDLDYVKSGAKLKLANYLATEANFPAMLRARIEILPSTPESKRRLDCLKGLLADLSSLDIEANRNKARELLRQVENEKAIFRVAPRPTGRTPKLIDFTRSKSKKLTDADLNNTICGVRFELEHGIGQTAPQISAPNALGDQMNLSSFRGKVVVLMFSKKDCAPCRAMYASNRELIKKHKANNAPFAFLGVMGDETIDTVVESINDESVNWHVWWDNDKSISTKWNIDGWPTVYVLDKNGTIRFRDVRGEDLARAVDKLLTPATASVSIQH